MLIAVDFDGTIVDHRYPEIGRPVPGAFEWLQKFRENGATLILWTMRSGDTLAEAAEFLAKHGVGFEHLNDHPQDWTDSRKVYAHVYIDDAAFGCPLRENPRMGGRPFVDWGRVGPEVLKMLAPATPAEAGEGE